MDGFLFQGFIFLTAAVISVPIAARLGLGSVLGYLIAGVAIAPLLRVVGVDTETLQHFAEFGVVMMLFLVGLELEPRLLWSMRARLIGLGGGQIALTAGAFAAIGLAFGLDWRLALALALILALSSTAIVLQTLRERGLMRTEGGRASFSILLFQDVAVIPILAVLPLLAAPDLIGTEIAAAHGAEAGEAADLGGSAIGALPGWAQFLLTIGAFAAVLVAGRFGVRPVLKVIAVTGLREMFTAAALLLVVAISFLMTLVGLSPALGAFAAGVVLADSEYRHELEADIEPFKGLLLGLFFITVGAGIDFSIIAAEPARALGLAAALIAVKLAVLFGIAAAFRLPPSDRWLTALGLAQAGEFAFVLSSFALAEGVLPAGVAAQLNVAVALSMFATPALFILYARVVQPRFRGAPAAEREADTVEERGVALIAGLGRFGQIVHRMLHASGFHSVILDHSAAQIELLQSFGVKAYYGDASSPALLHAAGIEEAKVFVCTLADREKSVAIVTHVKSRFPHIHVIARATDRLHYYALRAAGADVVHREMFGSSLEAGADALLALGVSARRAREISEAFRAHDLEGLRELYEHWREDPDVLRNPGYMSRARAMTETLRSVLSDDREAEEEGDAIAAPAAAEPPDA